MKDRQRAGAFPVTRGRGGSRVPFHVIPFDADGACSGPATQDALIAEAANATDVFVLRHGWNNDWRTAIDRYNAFTATLVDLQDRWWDPPSRPYRPLLAGVFWPSTVLVSAARQAPDIAGGPANTDGIDADISALASSLPDGQAKRLRSLAARPLDLVGIRELATLLAPVLGADGDELSSAPTTANDLAAVWRQLPPQLAGPSPADHPGGFIPDDLGLAASTQGPHVAGDFDLRNLDPRNIVRMATVLMMKDRAGRVGARGVAALLHRLLGASPRSRVHLIGHSYGARVVLSALCADPAPSRSVESVLLLQPAVSCLCFAADADGLGTHGGYRVALNRTRQPVITTYSRHDWPLTRLFHWAVRRAADLGEARIAGPDGAPSRYAALGGYGPQGTRPGEVAWVEAPAPPQRYVVSGTSTRLIAVDGNAVISSHRDVVNPATGWALLCQAMADDMQDAASAEGGREEAIVAGALTAFIGGPEGATQPDVLRGHDDAVVLRILRDVPDGNLVRFELSDQGGPFEPVVSGSLGGLGVSSGWRTRSPALNDPLRWMPPRASRPFVDRLAQALAHRRDEVLWLQLPSPSSGLHTLPWEAMLAPLEMPILRMCPTMPLPRLGAPSVHVAVGMGRSRMAWHGTLQSFDPVRFWQSATGLEVNLRVFRDPAQSVDLPTGKLDDLWLDGMHGALDGVALDVLHLIGPGAFVGRRGVIVGPGDEPQPVSAAQISAFLGKTGAWLLVLTGSARDGSMAALRDVADAVAAARPCVVAVQDMAARGRNSHQTLGEAMRSLLEPALLGFRSPEHELRREHDTAYWAAPSFANGTLLQEGGPPVGPKARAILARSRPPAWVASYLRELESRTDELSPDGPGGQPDQDVVAARTRLADLLEVLVEREAAEG